MLHLLQFACTTTNQPTCVVLTHESYLSFLKHGGTGHIFEFFHQEENKKCSFVLEVNYDQKIPNNSHLLKEIMKWIFIQEMEEKGPSVLAFHIEVYPCPLSDCDCSEVITNERHQIILSSAQATKFEALGGRYHSFPAPEIYRCSNGHVIEAFWTHPVISSLSHNRKVSIDHALSSAVIAWLNSEEEELLSFGLNIDNNRDLFEEVLEAVKEMKELHHVTLTRAQLLRFHELKLPRVEFHKHAAEHCDRLINFFWEFNGTSSLQRLSGTQVDKTLQAEVLQLLEFLTS